jgi:putative hemolysin
VKPAKIRALLAVALLLAAAGCKSRDIGPDPGPPPPVPPDPPTALSNPASENCIRVGGKLAFDEHPGGGQYGICLFDDNRQCEEWALMRGHCPAGGIKVTGYVTPESRFCAISGGRYTITANSGKDDEQGNCVLPDGRTCDAAAYFGGSCAAK